MSSSLVETEITSEELYSTESTVSVRRCLIAILIVGALVRIVLVLAFGDRPPVIDDARDYDQLATDLAHSGRYVDAAGRPTSLRPPLFPWVVSIIYRSSGVGNYQAVSLFQAGLSLATVGVAYRLGAALYSPVVGLAAAAALSVYPSLLVYNQLLLSEVLFTFFVTTGAWLTVLTVNKARLPLALALGAVLGLGALTRSVLWLFSPLLAVLIGLLSRAGWRRGFASGCAVVLAFAAIIAPWAWRNTLVQHTLTFVDVMGGRNVMMGNYEYTPLDRSWATISTETGDRAWYKVLSRETPGYAQLTQGQIDKLAMRHGVNYFFTHPWQSLERSTVKFFNFWQLEREVVAGLWQGLFGEYSRAAVAAAAVAICGSYAAAIFFGIAGALVVPPADRRGHWLLMAWILFPCLLHSIAFGHSRYHLPLMPIVLVYASAAAVNHAEFWDPRRKHARLVAIVACFLLAASWLREFVVVDWDLFT
jgi:4-amino-4-deoxy-L-arabinose transferase-like glycosyltransferase